MPAMHDDTSQKVSTSKLFLFKPVLDWLRTEQPKRVILHGFADTEWSVVVVLYRDPIAGAIPAALFSMNGVIDGAITLFPRAGRLLALNSRTDPPQDMQIVLFGDEDFFERNQAILKEEQG